MNQSVLLLGVEDVFELQCRKDLQWDPKGAPASVGLRKQLIKIDTRRV